MSLGLGLGLDKNSFISSGGFTPLLDTYGGAAAAYSIRLLSSTYSGALVEIRRSSDNATKAFLPDSNNELSMSSEAVVGSQTLSAFIGSNDGFVVTWYDQSGNGNDLTNSTASEQVQIVSSGSLIQVNSRVSSQSNGNNTYTKTITQLAAQSEMTAFVVHKTISQTSIDGIFNVGDLSTGVDNFGLTNEYAIRYAGGSTTYSPLNNLNQHIITAKWNTGSSTNNQLWINGVQATQSGSATINAITGEFTLLQNSATATDRGIEYLQELIIYPSNQLSNRANIETNQNDFFSIY